MIKSRRSARATATILFVVSLLLSVESVFIDPNFLGAAINISIAFNFYFVIRNPDIVLAENFEDFGKKLDVTVDRKFLYGTTPWFPAILLLAVLYISYARYGLPFG